jgi:hypothetical protein
MTEYSSDDTRLRAEEEQMRRALGLREQASTPIAPVPVRSPSNGSPRPHRRFIRDGEVAVEVVHHEGLGINQLEAARQTIRALTVAREQSERQLSEAQTTIRDLQTKLAHERLARDEAARHAAAEKEAAGEILQSARADLEAERAARRLAEQQLADVLARSAEAEVRAEQARLGPNEPQNTQRVASNVAGSTATPGRRGRPRKQPEPRSEEDFVEWWKPGWKEQYR